MSGSLADLLNLEALKTLNVEGATALTLTREVPVKLLKGRSKVIDVSKHPLAALPCLRTVTGAGEPPF